MKRDENRAGLERRGFLKGVGLAAGGAAAAVAPSVAKAAEQDEAPEAQAKARYQESDHVKRFYALNRL